MKLLIKFMALRAANKAEKMLSVPEIKILLQCFRRNGDLPIPQTRQALLTRLVETSHRGDHQAPQEITTLALSPIPPILFSLSLWLPIGLTQNKGEIDIPALPCFEYSCWRSRKNMKGERRRKRRRWRWRWRNKQRNKQTESSW